MTENGKFLPIHAVAGVLMQTMKASLGSLLYYYLLKNPLKKQKRRILYHPYKEDYLFCWGGS